MSDPNKQLFDNYARHYESMAVIERLPDDIERLKRDRLPRWIDEVPRNSRILDAGCAQGHLLAALQRVGFTDLTGVDLSSQLLQTASRLVPCARLIESDIRDFLAGCPDEAFDIIFFHDVLEHLPREVTIPLLQAFYRVLAPGGRLSLRVPNLGALTGGQNAAIDFTHITHFTEHSLLQVLEAAGFDPTRVYLECQAPRLFWSWRKPHRAFFRFLNRLRWHLNNGVHLALYLLADFRPRPTVFDPNLLVIARK
jgi:SAM-dependent methyltransferase